MKQSDTAAIEIRQHNAITTARYEMTACEMDVVFYLLSLLKKEDRTGTLYKVRVKDLESLTGRQWNYQQFLEATSSLRTREYVIEDKKRLLQVGLLASAEYLKGEGVIELEISEKIRPYLIDLKNNFTSYRLQAAFSLSSKYAKRIYQIASQWKDVGESKTFTISDFKVMLHLKDPKGIEAEQYTKVSMFQKFVLDVAVKQINQHTDLQIQYELIKKGRSFESIRFFIKQQTPQQLPLQFERPAEDGKVELARHHLKALGIVDPQLVERILGEERLVGEVNAFAYKLKTQKIKAAKNPAGLLLKVLGLR
ncbi:replication initiation protein [Hymenobacter latericus]|uniref:replication initiation protein n=1 Tax=Hymenobacter sp. YIM 151858-1 TaxID=2987688 RepID=UPI0022277830|nr:replication initiation protein [Hymenobacter sp. YIM 151858-1]UYZ61158.1 replication initiation protein [Hymenobacter sp. YIM 151858-1]